MPVKNDDGGTMITATLRMSFIVLCGILAGCDTEVENAAPLSVRMMQEKIPLDSLVSLGSIVDADKNSTVCVLGFYQDSITDDQLYAARANEYLQSIDYHGSEGTWSIVWISPNNISITKIKLYEFYPVSLNELIDEGRLQRRDDLEGFECAPLDEVNVFRSAITVKFDQAEKEYMVLLMVRRKMQ